MIRYARVFRVPVQITKEDQRYFVEIGGGLVALPGLEPGLFALRGRRVNQLHHNAMFEAGFECDFFIIQALAGMESLRG